MAMKYRYAHQEDYKHLTPKVSEVICVDNIREDDQKYRIYFHPTKAGLFLDKRVQADLRSFGVFTSGNILVRLLVDKVSKWSSYGMFAIEMLVNRPDELESIMPLQVAADITEHYTAFRLEAEMRKL